MKWWLILEGGRGYIFYVRMTAQWTLEYTYFFGFYSVENFNIVCNLQIFNNIDMINLFENSMIFMIDPFEHT